MPTLVVTHGRQRRDARCRAATRHASPAEPIDKVVDTTGAGDLFAAGFLRGQAQGCDLETSLQLGAICAAEIISHVGAAPECRYQGAGGGNSCSAERSPGDAATKKAGDRSPAFFVPARPPITERLGGFRLHRRIVDHMSTIPRPTWLRQPAVEEVDQQPDRAPDRQHQDRDAAAARNQPDTQPMIASGATTHTHGVRNGRWRLGSVLRSTITASATMKNANNVPELE